MERTRSARASGTVETPDRTPRTPDGASAGTTTTGTDGAQITRRAPFGTNPTVGERGSETEARILAAALEVFAEVGFSGARVELITERAGCSRPAFYQYYPNKDEVFWKLARELGRRMVALGRSLEPVGADEAGLDLLATWMDDFTTLYLDYHPIFAAFQAATHGHLDLARDSGAFGGRLDTALLRAFGRDTRRTADRALASAMAAVLIRCNFYWHAMDAGETIGRPRFTGHLARATHRLFHGPVAGVNIDPETRDTQAPGRTGDSGAPTVPTFARPAVSHDARPLRSRGRETRQRLLDAGAEVLPERGYHNTRVDDLARAAGASHGTFYRYFADKDDFFRALAEQAGGEMIDLLERFPLDDDRTVLTSWLGSWFESYRSNGGVITVWQEMQEARGELVAYSQQVATVIVAGLVELMDSRGNQDPLLDALVLLALIERLPYRAYTLGYTTADAAIDAAATIIRRSILGLSA